MGVGSLADVLLSPIGVSRLDTDGPNSALLGNLPRTLPKGEPRRGYAKCFGQRFEHVHAGLPTILNLSEGTGTEIRKPSQSGLRESALNPNRGQTCPHTICRHCQSTIRWLSNAVPKPARTDSERRGQTSKGADCGRSSASLNFAWRSLIATHFLCDHVASQTLTSSGLAHAGGQTEMTRIATATNHRQVVARAEPRS